MNASIDSKKQRKKSKKKKGAGELSMSSNGGKRGENSIVGKRRSNIQEILEVDDDLPEYSAQQQ